MFMVFSAFQKLMVKMEGEYDVWRDREGKKHEASVSTVKWVGVECQP